MLHALVWGDKLTFGLQTDVVVWGMMGFGGVPDDETILSKFSVTKS